MKKIILSVFVIAASGAYVWSQAGNTSDPLLASADLQTGSIQPQAVASTGGTMNVAPREVPFVTREKTASAAPAPSAPLSAPAPATKGPLPPLPAPADSSGFAPMATASNNTKPSAPAAPATPSQPAPFAVADAQTPAAPSAPASSDANTVAIPMPRLRPPYHRVASATPTSALSSAPDPAAASALRRIAAATSGLNDGTYRGPIENAYYGLMQIEAVVRGGRLARIHVIRYPNTHSTSIYINRRALPELRNEVINAQSAHVDTVSGATLSSHAFIRSLSAALRKARV